MKPVSFRALHSSNFLSGSFNNNFGSKNTVASIKGSVKKLGAKYNLSSVGLYNRINLLPVAVCKPNTNGDYQFTGINADLKCLMVALDSTQQYNAVIQDMVVPK